MGRIGHLQHHRGIPILLEELLERELREVLGFVSSLLLSLGGERLSEVTIAIEEADSRETDIAVTGLLEIVPSQDPETTRVDLQDVRQSILHTEVGDRGADAVRRLVHIGTEVGIYFVELLHEALIGYEGGNFFARELARQSDRITFGSLPQLGGETTEEGLRLRAPYPPEIVR